MAIPCGELAIVERFIAAGVRPQRRSPAPRPGGSPGGIAPSWVGATARHAPPTLATKPRSRIGSGVARSAG
jgi:hypothetical protein